MVKQKKGSIGFHNNLSAALSRGADILIISSSLWLLTSGFTIPWSEMYTIATFVALVLFIIFSEISGLYDFGNFSNKQKIIQVFAIWFWVIFALLILAYASKTSSFYSRKALLIWIFITPLLLSFLRVAIWGIFHNIQNSKKNTRNIAIVGANEQAIQVTNELKRLSRSNLKLVGYFDEHSPIAHRPIAENQAEVMGNIADVITLAKNNEIDVIFIALPMNRESTICNLINDLADTTVETYIIPDLFISNLLNTHFGYIGNIPFLNIHHRPFNDIDGWIKRAEDIIIGSLILAGIALPMLLITIIIKLTSTGPVLFKQKRYGISGEVIKVWKFRTMTTCEDGKEIKQAKKNDARLTKIGALLRKTSLDELPQFINVLQGTMSIVGPRPHAISHNEKYRKQITGYMLRHTVKPGITGWAQVNGLRGETKTLDKMKKRIDYDLWYIKNWNLSLDIKIIFLTVINGFVGENAY